MMDPVCAGILTCTPPSSTPTGANEPSTNGSNYVGRRRSVRTRTLIAVTYETSLLAHGAVVVQCPSEHAWSSALAIIAWNPALLIGTANVDADRQSLIQNAMIP